MPFFSNNNTSDPYKKAGKISVQTFKGNYSDDDDEFYDSVGSPGVSYPESIEQSPKQPNSDSSPYSKIIDVPYEISMIGTPINLNKDNNYQIKYLNRSPLDSEIDNVISSHSSRSNSPISSETSYNSKTIYSTNEDYLPQSTRIITVNKKQPISPLYQSVLSPNSHSSNEDDEKYQKMSSRLVLSETQAARATSKLAKLGTALGLDNVHTSSSLDDVTSLLLAGVPALFNSLRQESKLYKERLDLLSNTLEELKKSNNSIQDKNDLLSKKNRDLLMAAQTYDENIENHISKQSIYEKEISKITEERTSFQNENNNLKDRIALIDSQNNILEKENNALNIRCETLNEANVQFDAELSILRNEKIPELLNIIKNQVNKSDTLEQKLVMITNYISDTGFNSEINISILTTILEMASIPFEDENINNQINIEGIKSITTTTTTTTTKKKSAMEKLSSKITELVNTSKEKESLILQLKTENKTLIDKVKISIDPSEYNSISQELRTLKEEYNKNELNLNETINKLKNDNGILIEQHEQSINNIQEKSGYSLEELFGCKSKIDILEKSLLEANTDINMFKNSELSKNNEILELKNKLQELKTLYDELLENNSNLSTTCEEYKTKLSEAKTQIETHTKTTTEHTEITTKMKEDLSHLESKLSESESHYSEQRSLLITEHTEITNKLKEDLSQLESKLTESELHHSEQCSSLITKHTEITNKLKEDLSQLESKLTESESYYSEQRSLLITEHTEHCKQLELQLEETISKLKVSETVYSKDKDSWILRVTELEKEIAERDDKLALVPNISSDHVADLEAEILSLTAERDELLTKIKESDEELHQAHQDLIILQRDIEKLSSDHSNILDTHNITKANLEDELRDLQSECNSLRERLEMADNALHEKQLNPDSPISKSLSNKTVETITTTKITRKLKSKSKSLSGSRETSDDENSSSSIFDNNLLTTSENVETTEIIRPPIGMNMVSVETFESTESSNKSLIDDEVNNLKLEHQNKIDILVNQLKEKDELLSKYQIESNQYLEEMKIEHEKMMNEAKSDNIITIEEMDEIKDSYENQIKEITLQQVKYTTEIESLKSEIKRLTDENKTYIEKCIREYEEKIIQLETVITKSSTTTNNKFDLLIIERDNLLNENKKLLKEIEELTTLEKTISSTIILPNDSEHGDIMRMVRSISRKISAAKQMIESDKNTIEYLNEKLATYKDKEDGDVSDTEPKVEELEKHTAKLMDDVAVLEFELMKTRSLVNYYEEQNAALKKIGHEKEISSPTLPEKDRIETTTTTVTSIIYGPNGEEIDIEKMLAANIQLQKDLESTTEINQKLNRKITKLIKLAENLRMHMRGLIIYMSAQGIQPPNEAIEALERIDGKFGDQIDSLPLLQINSDLEPIDEKQQQQQQQILSPSQHSNRTSSMQNLAKVNAMKSANELFANESFKYDSTPSPPPRGTIVHTSVLPYSAKTKNTNRPLDGNLSDSNIENEINGPLPKSQKGKSVQIIENFANSEDNMRSILGQANFKHFDHIEEKSLPIQPQNLQSNYFVKENNLPPNNNQSWNGLLINSKPIIPSDVNITDEKYLMGAPQPIKITDSNKKNKKSKFWF